MKSILLIYLLLFLLIDGIAQEKTPTTKIDTIEKVQNYNQSNRWKKVFSLENFKIDSSFQSVKKSNFNNQTSINATNDISLGGITIHFKDGTTKKGNKLKFNSNGYIQIEGYTLTKKKRYHVNLVNYVITSKNYMDNEGNFYPGEKIIYRKISGTYKNLKVISEGKVNLYMYEKLSDNQMVYTVREYYVQRKEEIQMVLIARNKMSNKKFIYKAIAYFNNCPELVSKIENNTYTYKDIIDIVRYYNLYCL